MTDVLYESKNNISYIYLNRPERYNVLNKGGLDQLLEILKKVEKNEDKVLIISGKGPAFSAGGDVGSMKEGLSKEEYDLLMGTVDSIILKIYMMPKIVISAIHGPAVGLGLSLALTADYVVAQREAKLGVMFMGIALLPDGGGHFWLSERMGVQRAKEFIWSLEQVDGQLAKSMGLIDILANGDAIDEAIKIGQKIVHGPTLAMLKTKMMYHNQKLETLKHYLAEEQIAQWELMNTEDHQEGVSAFLEKRQAKFKGK